MSPGFITRWLMISKVLIINKVYLSTCTSAKSLHLLLSEATDGPQPWSCTALLNALTAVLRPRDNRSAEGHRLLPLPLHANRSSDAKVDNRRLRFLFIWKT